MDSILNIRFAPLPVKLPGIGASGNSAPALPSGIDASVPLQGGGAAADPQQQRYEAVLKVAQEIANTSILGTLTFSMFKDASGQLVTCFTDPSGKKTYIPEPNMLKMGNAAATPTVTLTA